MAMVLIKARLAACWRPVGRRLAATVLGGILLGGTGLGPAAADEPAVRFVAPAAGALPPAVPCAAVETPELGEEVRFVSPATNPASQAANLVNPLATSPSAPPAPTASYQAEPADYEASAAPPDKASPLTPVFEMQPAEEVAPLDAGRTEVDRRLYRPIADVTVDAALPAGLAPGEPGSEIEQPPTPPTPVFGDERLLAGWAETDFRWSATCLCHRPLYFEEVNVERYGYTVSPVLQPFISGAHFFATIPVLPYKMTTHPPRECIYTLGYYRAGDCVPRRWHHEPWSPAAAAVEGGVVTGLIFAIP
jgi:hypothetical protein